MRMQNILAASLLALGLSLTPTLLPSAHGADDTAQKQPSQDQPRGQRGPGGYLERYHKSVLALSLTDEQKPKIETAFADAKTKMEAATKDASGDRAAMREKIKPIMDDLRKSVDEVLTKEQKDTLAKERANRQRNRGQQPADQKPPQ